MTHPVLAEYRRTLSDGREVVIRRKLDGDWEYWECALADSPDGWEAGSPLEGVLMDVVHADLREDERHDDYDPELSDIAREIEGSPGGEES